MNTMTTTLGALALVTANDAEADDAATWGALTLLGLSRKMLESAAYTAMVEEQAVQS